MKRYVLPLLLAGLGLTALPLLDRAVADAADAVEGDEPPLRLKKKKKAPDEGPKEEKKAPEPKKGAGAKEKEEPLMPEDGNAEPQEDEKEVLARVQKNMRAAEEKLANREVGEPTRQMQRDVLKDLDELINRAQQPPPPPKDPQGGGGGGGGGKDNPQGGGKQGAGAPQGGGKQAGGKQSSRRQRASRKRGSGSGKQVAKGNGKQGSGQSGGPSDKGGAGGKSPPRGNDPKHEGKDGAWGHLPESLRAEMSAFANPEPFLPRYDDLIRKYYRTIAEQGRRKGD